MTMRTSLPVALLLGTMLAHAQQAPAPAPAAPAPAAPADERRHYVLRTKADGVVQFEMTEIVRASKDGKETVLLVTDNLHGTLVLEHRPSSTSGTTWTIRNTGRQDFVTTTVTTEPGKPSRTTVATRAGATRVSEAETGAWPQLRDLRYSIRQDLSPALLEGIERMRATVFAVAPGNAFYDMVGRYVLYQDGPAALVAELEETPMPPSCLYDEDFGVPCSAEQLERVTAAAEEGTLLPKY